MGRVYVSGALTRHQLSWILTAFNQTPDSEIEMEPYSVGMDVTMVTVEVCDPPTSQRRQCCLFFFYEKISTLTHLPPSPFCSLWFSLVDRSARNNHTDFHFWGLLGNLDVPQVCLSARFSPSVVSLENLHWIQYLYPINISEPATAPYPHGAVKHGNDSC